jgi:hypothetical protein
MVATKFEGEFYKQQIQRKKSIDTTFKNGDILKVILLMEK